MVMRQREISAQAAARALTPFLAEYHAQTGIDLVDRIGTDRKLLRLALAHTELSTLIDDTTGIAAQQASGQDDSTTAVQGRRLSQRINQQLYLTADEIRHRLRLLAASRSGPRNCGD